ncbi:MAG: hypothetical protein WCX76_01900 [Candidatus Methanomethylophilaceae archaeon]
MYNVDKDFNRIVIDSLGKDGKSISALTKDLEERGIKQHRLIVTGYLRALTDMNILKEREVPPSKIYQPSKALPDSIYESVGKACRKIDPDADELILYTLSRLFKRPIFDTELKLAGVNRPIGRSASDNETKECKRIMARAGNVLTSSNALHPSREFPDKMSEVLTEVVLDIKDCRHAVMETRQTKLSLE